MQKLFLFLSIFFSFATLAQLIDYSHLPFSPSIKQKIAHQKIIIQSKVKNEKEQQQSLHFKLAALHPRSCQIALRKLSRYETFHQYIDFIDRSEYNDQTHQLYFRLKSALLPYTMILKFKFDRISHPGIYPFQFDYGFLKGLKGVVHISEYHHHCLFYSQADWQGPDSKIPNLVFEFFTEALSKILVEKLFKISRF